MNKGLYKDDFIFSGDILTDFEGLAYEHSALQGSGDDRLREAGICWIVVSHRFEIVRMPEEGEKGSANTRNGRVRPALGRYPRYFVLRDASGELLVKGCSIYSLMDMKTRGFADASGLGIHFDDQTEEDDLKDLVRIPRFETTHGTDILIVEKMIDLNGHMNNKHYMTLGLHALGIDEKQLKSVYIRYENEVFAGETLQLAWGAENGLTLVTGSAGDRKIFRMLLETR